MTKAEVAKRLQERTGLSGQQAALAVDELLSCIKDALKRGERVSLVGFGTFFVKERNAKNGLNPKTGERIEIPGKRVAAFKPGKAFREAVEKLDTRQEAEQ